MTVASAPRPRVSVVVPVHEDAAALRSCLAALREQDLAPSCYEVLVCDNGSTRDPVTDADVAPPAGSHGPDVRLVTSGELGSYRARNRCLAIARGSVLAFTDADCRPHASWLSAGLADLDSSGGALLAGRVATYARHHPPTPVELFEVETAFPQEKYVTTMSFGVTANLFVRRDVFDAVGPFDDHLLSGGDREFCERAVRRGHRIAYSAAAVVDHPARASASELATKAERVIAGARADGRLRSPSRLAAGIRPPLGALGRARRSPRLTSQRDRAMYVVGELTAHYVRWLAEVKVRLRGRNGRSPAVRPHRP